MNTIYISHKDYDRSLKTNEYSCLEYYSKKATKKKFPTGDYVILGCIGTGMKQEKGTFVDGMNNEHSYYTMKFSRFHYGIDGFVDVGNGNCLAVVKNRLPRNLSVVLLALVCIAALSFYVYTFINRVDLDSRAVDYNPKFAKEMKTDPNHIGLPGYGDIQMIADTDTAAIALWNPKTNPCYFKFTITMEEKTIFESSKIAPGKAITKVKFNQKIPKGVHEIKIKIESYSLEDGETKMNGGVAVTKLIALES